MCSQRRQGAKGLCVFARTFYDFVFFSVLHCDGKTMLMKLYPILRILIPFVFLLSSCAVTDTVVAHYNSDQPTRAKHLTHIGKTHWSFAWGLIKKGDWAAGCQQGSNMSRVRVTTNPGFIIISFVTLGIVIPQKLEWDCGPASRGTGIIGK